jgi:hypothetical protein
MDKQSKNCKPEAVYVFLKEGTKVKYCLNGKFVNFKVRKTGYYNRDLYR